MGSQPDVSLTRKFKMTETAAAKAPKTKPAHPPTSVMIVNAVTALKERNGSSLPAIKKYIAANYKADTVKLAPFIKKGLKNLVEKKVLIQTKGKGASGSFKVAKVEKKEKKAAKPKSPKKKAPKKAKSPVKKAKKPAAKKPAAAKKTTPKKTAAKKK